MIMSWYFHYSCLCANILYLVSCFHMLFWGVTQTFEILCLFFANIRAWYAKISNKPLFFFKKALSTVFNVKLAHTIYLGHQKWHSFKLWMHVFDDEPAQKLLNEQKSNISGKNGHIIATSHEQKSKLANSHEVSHQSLNEYYGRNKICFEIFPNMYKIKFSTFPRFLITIKLN